LTRPGTLFGSSSTNGVRVRRAASAAGALANPPMLTTTSASATSPRQARAPRHASHAARAVAGESRLCAEATSRPTNGNPAAGTSDASWPSRAPTNVTVAP
jgi:hypothetical protein